MKVLYLSSWERSNDGGSSRVAFEIAQEAHQAGIKSAIIYPGIENKVFIRDGVTNITIESIIDEDSQSYRSIHRNNRANLCN